MLSYYNIQIMWMIILFFIFKETIHRGIVPLKRRLDAWCQCHIIPAQPPLSSFMILKVVFSKFWSLSYEPTVKFSPKTLCLTLQCNGFYHSTQLYTATRVNYL